MHVQMSCLTLFPIFISLPQVRFERSHTTLFRGGLYLKHLIIKVCRVNKRCELHSRLQNVQVRWRHVTNILPTESPVITSFQSIWAEFQQPLSGIIQCADYFILTLLCQTSPYYGDVTLFCERIVAETGKKTTLLMTLNQ